MPKFTELAPYPQVPLLLHKLMAPGQGALLLLITSVRAQARNSGNFRLIFMDRLHAITESFRAAADVGVPRLPGFRLPHLAAR